MTDISARASSPHVLLAILAAAFNLRIGIVSVGPVIEDIRADTSMSSGLAGVLTTIPFLCMGLFAFVGPPLVQRLGSPRVMAGALGLIAIGALGRSAATAAWLVIATTLPIGLGIALIGAGLPSVVKQRFPQRAGAVTGAYVSSLSVAVAIVGIGLIPLVEALDSWRAALAFTALPAGLAILPWLGLIQRRRGSRAGHVPAADAPPRWRKPTSTSLLLGVIFGLQSLSFAGMVSWAPAIYEEAGWSAQAAAQTTTSIGVLTIVSALIFPPLSDGRDRRLFLAVIATVMGIGLFGVALLTTSGAWVWLTMFGLGTGAVFPLMLALPLDLHDSPRDVAETTAWMLGIGYSTAALAPVLIGALRDATGGFTLAISLLGSFAVAAGALSLLTRSRARRAQAMLNEPSPGESLSAN